MYSKLLRLAVSTAIAAGVLALLAGSASGHQLTGTTITCSTVSGHFTDFGLADHPIVWHIQVDTGGTQAVPATETPAAFVGSGTASADITSVTDQLLGTTATVHAFATWPGGQSATTSATVTCGTPLGGTTPPIQVGGVGAVAPGSAGVSTLVVPAAPVPSAVTFTG